MLKKVLTTMVLAVSALGVMAANAAAPGIYVTGQLGYANTHMKDKTLLGNLKQLFVFDSVASANLSNNGLAGRLALGYQFNQHVAIEMGYMHLAKSQVNADILSNNPITTVAVSTSLQQNTVDFLGKGILPISDKFNVYGKLGVAYLTSNINFKNKEGTKSGANNDFDVAKHKWAPEAAVGVSYDITPNVSVDTSWTHIQPLGNKRPGNIDFVAVGIGYNFG